MNDPSPGSTRATRGTILGRARGGSAGAGAGHVEASGADVEASGADVEASGADVEASGGDLGTVEGEPEPELAGEDLDAPVGAGRGAVGAERAARWPLVGCVVLGLAALVFAVVALQQRSSRQTEQEQTAELRDVSGRTIAALTSYDYQHLDQWKKSVLANATGSFQNQFESGFSGFEQTYVAEHNRGTGAIQGVWVGPVASGKATTVVLVQITVTSLTGTNTLEPYVQITLLKVAGRWRVDDVQATFDTSGGGNSGASGATVPPNSTATSTPSPAP